MNLQNLLAQLGNATNPMAMLTNILNPNQKQMLSMFQGKNEMEQAEQIARICNEKGISKEQLQNIINMVNKK